MSELRRDVRVTTPNHGQALRTEFLLHGDKGTVQFVFADYQGYKGFAMPYDMTYTRQAIDVGYHWDTPQYDGQEPMDCHVRPSGKCYYDGSGLLANEFYEDFSRLGSEFLWGKLAGYYMDIDGRDK